MVRPAPGELVSFLAIDGTPYSTGLLIGYSFGSPNLSYPIFNSIDDIIKARPPCRVGDRVHLDIIENGTGRRMKTWMLGKVQPA